MNRHYCISRVQVGGFVCLWEMDKPGRWKLPENSGHVLARFYVNCAGGNVLLDAALETIARRTDSTVFDMRSGAYRVGGIDDLVGASA